MRTVAANCWATPAPETATLSQLKLFTELAEERLLLLVMLAVGWKLLQIFVDAETDTDTDADAADDDDLFTFKLVTSTLLLLLLLLCRAR